MTSGDNYWGGERGSKTEDCGEEKELADSLLANHKRQVWEGGREGEGGEGGILGTNSPVEEVAAERLKKCLNWRTSGRHLKAGGPPHLPAGTNNITVDGASRAPSWTQ
ncbi:hypothetical protein E2C01_025916 [Portunus trituberculatus]|uniref:Uncharacterized protein n=1 Tax=Portunus trituberculatus TaxID=210409 RepID=A0A5B7EGQ8_PORTR|nr:hypothetical protein [Portunus trituberculatus]